MFCSKCGKTIHASDLICPGCGAAIGDNRFGGIAYTSAQFTIAPGQKEFGPRQPAEGSGEGENREPAAEQTEGTSMRRHFGTGADYTKTSYTGMADRDQEDADTDGRTTYRPVYEGASAPEEVRKAMRAEVDSTGEEKEEDREDQRQDGEDTENKSDEGLARAAQASLEEIFDQLQPVERTDENQFQTAPIEAKARTGISEDVKEYVRSLEEEQLRKGRRREDFRSAPQPRPEEDEAEYDQDADEAEEGEAPREAPARPDAPKGEDYDAESEEDYADDNYRTIGGSTILKIAVAVLIVAALIVGGILVINNIRKGSKSQTTIEGVTEELRTEGIALLRAHADTDYVSSLIDMYTTDGVLTMSTQLSQDSAAIDALLPADAAEYDATFIDALQAIQTDINTAVTMDAIAAENVTTEAVSDSDARWQNVNSQITTLEACTTAEELTAIISGTRLTLVESTPAPTATPVVYTTLAKGDVSNEVLELQVRLYELGYLNDDRDGKYGAKTQTAVKAFQENTGLNATGIADNATLTLLYSDDAPYAPGATTPTPAPTPTPTPEPVIQPAEAAGDGTAEETTTEEVASEGTNEA